MKNIIKSKVDKIVAGALLFLLLMGYCYIAGLSLFIPFLLLLFAFHLVYHRRASGKRLLHIGLLISLIVFTIHAMHEYSSYSSLYVPVTSVSMLAMLLFSELSLAFSMAFVVSSLATLSVGAGVDYLMIFFSSSLIASYAVRNARTRGRILWTGVIIGAVQIVVYLLFHPQISSQAWEEAIRPLFINGIFSAMTVIATLKVFEYLFGELTNFSLLELSDSLNQPLLKRMAFEAPGTYHHSLVLSNIAGAAADRIQANQLLVRVGSYYHDIGKLVKPEYFNENQMMTANKHDTLEPNMSRLVILNHVKEGTEIARKAGLSQKIIDFIQQHHGTSLIHYFYQRALEAKGAENVSKENYRYPGPKPQTKEVAIVMLADAVEGATRAMDEHTPPKIDDVVRRVINNKFIDGQLDECSLTLREIEQIGTAFSHALSAMYHVRVKYPEASKKTNGHTPKQQTSQDKASS